MLGKHDAVGVTDGETGDLILLAADGERDRDSLFRVNAHGDGGGAEVRLADANRDKCDLAVSGVELQGLYAAVRLDGDMGGGHKAVIVHILADVADAVARHLAE